MLCALGNVINLLPWYSDLLVAKMFLRVKIEISQVWVPISFTAERYQIVKTNGAFVSSFLSIFSTFDLVVEQVFYLCGQDVG